MRDLILILLFLLVSSSAGVENSPTKFAGEAAPQPVSDPEKLHDLILERFKEAKYAESASLLDQLSTSDTQRFRDLPYALLRAKSYALSGNFDKAIDLYKEIAEQPELRRFAALPAARLAAERGKPQLAIDFYQKALRISDHPEYPVVAREAMDYCWLMKRGDDLRNTSEIIRSHSALRRTSEFYSAKAHLLKGDRETAKQLFQKLIAAPKEDDITSQALLELDQLEGKLLTEDHAISRGKLAYRVWNFELAAKYLAPYSKRSIEEAYLYARAISFLGETATAKKLLREAAEKWPDDPFAKLSLNQYGNVCLRDGDYRGAAEVFKRLRKPGASMDDATIKLIFALRAQLKAMEAIELLNPYTRTGKKSHRHRAIFLRGRTYYQAGMYREAFTDFDRLIKEAAPNKRELLSWKGITLEKMGRPEEASVAYRAVAQGRDFYTFHAVDKLTAAGEQIDFSSGSNPDFQLCILPDKNDEEKILELKNSGDLVPSLLYLGLYEEAAQILNSISASGWNLLGVDPSNRRQKLLSLSYLAGLGENYPSATYYSELFLKNVPDETSLFSASENVLKALFPIPYREPVSRFSQERQLDPLFVLSIMKQESKFKRQARSPAFARGLMQLIPSTANKVASDLGIKDFSLEQLYHPEININLGTKYLKDLAARFGNKVELMAAGYNSGESNVRRWLDCTSSDEVLEFYSNIDLPETKNYVMIVKTNYESYRRIYNRKESDSANLSAGLE